MGCVEVAEYLLQLLRLDPLLEKQRTPKKYLHLQHLLEPSERIEANCKAKATAVKAVKAVKGKVV